MPTPAIARARNRNPGAFEAFETAERARLRTAAAIENDVRALERNADRLRDLGECWNTKADELEREAREMGRGDKMRKFAA
jgi:hypothetical protein